MLIIIDKPVPRAASNGRCEFGRCINILDGRHDRTEDFFIRVLVH